MNARERELTEDEYEAVVTDLYGTVTVCGTAYEAGHALRILDPTAFRCGLLDSEESARHDGDDWWVCGECETTHDTAEDAEACCRPEAEETEEV